MNIRSKLPAMMLATCLLVLIPSTGPAARLKDNKSDKAVYVCACLKDKSCSCMTEAKTQGPCACGTDGGPPMKAVPKDSAWAKENRDALAN